MVSDEQDGPIEIELTAHAPKRSRGRRSGAPDAAVTVAERPSAGPPPDRGNADPPLAPEPGWLGSERSRLVMSVAVAAVIALLIGWMLGRSGGDTTSAGDDAAPAATTPVAATEPEVDEPDPVFEEAEELPDADVDLDELFTPETSAPPVVTQPPPDREPERLEPELLQPAIDERALGRDLTLITADGQRRLLEIDLSTGEVRQRGDELPAVADSLFDGGDWVGVASQQSGQLLIDHDDGVRTELDGFPWWNMAVDVERDVIWNIDAGSRTGASYEERGLDGELTGRTLELPTDSWSALYDDGAFLSTVLGATYRIGPDGFEPVTSGEVLAASSNTLVLNDCDDALQCGLRVFDRSTGEARWLPPGPGGTERRFLPLSWYYGGPQTTGSLSPDGRWMVAVAIGGFSEDTGLLDLETGEFDELSVLGADGFGEQWTWAPDSSAAFFVQGRVPWVYDVETGETFRLSEDRLTWTGFVVRENAVG